VGAYNSPPASRPPPPPLPYTKNVISQLAHHKAFMTNAFNFRNNLKNMFYYNEIMYIPKKKHFLEKKFLLVTKSFSDPALGHMPH
jgi:CMP-N-acetylneuraminic acid synthetase